MIQLIKKIFGIGPKIDLGELIKKGATVVDVRSRGEYSGGHIKGTINVPLEELNGNLNKFKNKDHPIITCCASGMRSGLAKGILKSKGYSNVHNGGSWHNLKTYCK
jgi:phage shock protein E